MAPFLFRAHFNRRPSELFFWGGLLGLFFGALFDTGTIYRARIIRIGIQIGIKIAIQIGIQIGIQMPQAP
jgi:hypothetical protein